MKKNIGLVIIGHIASSRLEEKMLLPLGNQTFIEEVFDFAKNSFSGKIIFATPDDEIDNILAEMAINKNIQVVRGHKKDILRRYHKAATQHNLDGIVTWDGDDLFVDNLCLEKTSELLEAGADYIKPINLPYGTFSYGLSLKALQSIIDLRGEDDTDGWQKFITSLPDIKTAEYQSEKHAPLSRLRLTLDYPEDYELIKLVHAHIISSNSSSMFDGIEDFFKKNPEAEKINQNRIGEYQKRWESLYQKNFKNN